MSLTKARILRLVSSLENEQAFREFLGLASDTLPKGAIRGALKGLWSFMCGQGITRDLDKDNVLFAREVVGHFSPEHALRFALELNRNEGFYYHVRKERIIFSILNTHKLLSGHSIRKLAPISANEIINKPIDVETSKDFLEWGMQSAESGIHVVPLKRYSERIFEEAIPQPPITQEQVNSFIPIDKTLYNKPEYLILEDVSVSAEPTGICHGVFNPVMNYVYELSDQYHHFRVFGRTPDRRIGEVILRSILLPRYGMKNNYYHALVDRVSALYFAACFGKQIPVYSSFQVSELEQRLCSALKIDVGNVIYVEGLSHVAKYGIIPYMPAVRQHFYRYCRRMAMKARGRSEDKFGRRIYISRKGATARQLLNEDQVIEKVMAAGFQVLNFEHMTIEQQMVAMAGAEVVLAPHGAGLANMVFCDRGTRIVEMLSDGYPNASFRQMAYECDLCYTLLLGKKKKGDTWEISLDKLDMVLKQLASSTFSMKKKPKCAADAWVDSK